MNLSINGQSQIPPGFRFHPTEEELLHYYLRKKVTYEKIDLDVIREVDLNKLEPWDIQEKCKIGSTPQNDWYFFSHKDKKYPTGTRTNRATAAGFWKATGRDKIIYSGCTRIGLRKTLVFYKGRAPHGQKSDWIMHEYRLDDTATTAQDTTVLVGDSNTQEEGWVVCRVFKKKNYQKAVENPRNSTTSIETKLSHMLSSSGNSNGVLDHILVYMGRSCKMENEPFISNNIIGSDGCQERFMHLPRLQDSPTLSSQLPMITASSPPFDHDDQQIMIQSHDHDHQASSSTKVNAGAEVNDWAALDRLVASQLNGQETYSTTPSNSTYTTCAPNRAAIPNIGNQSSEPSQVVYNYGYNGLNSMIESDFWGFTKSLSSPSPAPSLDPLCHLSV